MREEAKPHSKIWDILVFYIHIETFLKVGIGYKRVANPQNTEIPFFKITRYNKLCRASQLHVKSKSRPTSPV